MTATIALIAATKVEVDGVNTLFDGDGQRAGMLVLIAFLLSFGFIRLSTRLMRSPRVPWWPGSVKPGGLHIHHLVFGIVLIMLAGFLSFALQPDSPWLEIFAVAFGIGVGLTLDEFALWLHLEDVYWSEEGRRSIDATVFAAIIGAAVVLGLAPFGGSGDDEGSIAVVASAIVIDLGFVITCVFKGKIWTGLIGFFMPIFALVGAIRAAKPDSPWARRLYRPGSRKMEKSQRRARRSEQRYRRWQDRIGGAPSLPSPLKAPGAEEKAEPTPED